MAGEVGLKAEFNVPCSGDGTFIFLICDEDSQNRYIEGVTRYSNGVQIQCFSAGIYSEIFIDVDNGIANVKAYGNIMAEENISYHCCFIPGDPFAGP